MALSPLPPIGTINGVPSTDTANPLYLPPTGYYQADDGSIVPKNTPSSTSQSGSPSVTQQAVGATSVLGDLLSMNPLGAIADSAIASGGPNQNIPFLGRSYEDIITIVIGLLLIAAGIFAFKTTQTVIQTGGRVARRGAEGAAAVAAL